MRYTFFALVLLAAVPAQAQRFEAWNNAGWIEGRDTQTGEVYTLSHFDTGIGEPLTASRLTVWLDSRMMPHAMGECIYGFGWHGVEMYGNPNHPSVGGEFPTLLSYPSKSDLRLSVVPSDTYKVFPENYWVAWRQGGGVWAYQVWPEPEYLHVPFEVLPDWTGDFELVGGEIHWTGGTTVLEAPPAPIPEPSAAMLLVGALGTAAAIALPRRLGRTKSRRQVGSDLRWGQGDRQVLVRVCQRCRLSHQRRPGRGVP